MHRSPQALQSLTGSSFDLSDKVALITGSSRGIGAAMARTFAANGATVALHASSPSERAESMHKELQATGAKTELFYADLGHDSASETLIGAVEQSLGKIDILVLNASVQWRQNWREASREAFDNQMRVNLGSCLEMIQKVAPSMEARGWGRILTLGSVQQDRPTPALPVYAASKAALMNLVRAIALDLAPSGVTVNCLSPGLIATDRNEVVRDTPEKLREIMKKVPVGFVGQPEDCAAAALLLCSEAGRYITGADWRIDGGWGLS